MEEYTWRKVELHCEKCRRYFWVDLPEPIDKDDTTGLCQECWEEIEDRRYRNAGLAECLGPLDY